MVTNAKAQNYINFSFYDVENVMRTRGYAVLVDKTDAGVVYLVASTSEQVRIYYFNRNNICIRYVYTVLDATYALLDQALRTNNYVRHSDGKYYYKDYVADIVYSDIFKCWVASVDLK